MGKRTRDDEMLCDPKVTTLVDSFLADSPDFQRFPKLNQQWLRNRLCNDVQTCIEDLIQLDVETLHEEMELRGFRLTGDFSKFDHLDDVPEGVEL